jgi:hypothetical protein
MDYIIYELEKHLSAKPVHDNSKRKVIKNMKISKKCATFYLLIV